MVAVAGAWGAELGVVTFAEAVRLSGLSDIEFAAALQQGLIAPQPCPFTQEFVPPYFDPAKLHLNEEKRKALNSQIRLTREQAAAYLGVPVAVFERRRHEAGIRHVPARGTHERLYRKVDVDKLKR